MCFSGTATVDIMLEVFYLFHQIYRMCIDVLSCRLEYFAIEISGGIHKFMLYEFLYEKCFLLSNVVHHQEPLFHLFVVFHERFSFRRIILTIIGRDTLLFLFPGTRDSVDFEDILRVYIHSDHLFQSSTAKTFCFGSSVDFSLQRSILMLHFGSIVGLNLPFM